MTEVMHRAAAKATVWSGQLHEHVTTAKRRVSDERGQTAAEYMGVLLLIGVIIAILVTSGIPGLIRDSIADIVRDISGGNNPRGEGAPPPNQ
jgi:Flp pilus assembly pilin Flp